MTSDVHDREPAGTFETVGARNAVRDLIPALSRLDARLELAAARASAVFGEHITGDRYRGLYVSDADVAHLFARSPAQPAFAEDGNLTSENGASVSPVGSRLSWLIGAFELAPFDIDVLVLAMAPDLDLRYERLYAYLQDDVTRRRPTVDLALNLFCATSADRVAHLSRFDTDAPLVRNGIIDLVAEGTAARSPLLATAIALDQQILSFLFGGEALDRRVGAFCSLLAADSFGSGIAADDEITDSLTTMVGDAYERGARIAFHFVGPRGTGKRATAAAVASRLGRPILMIDIARAMESGEWDRTLMLVRREAWLRGAILYVHGCDVVLAADRESRRADLESLASSFSGPVVLSSTRPWPDAVVGGVIEVPFDVPSFERQADLWVRTVAWHGGSLSPNEASSLASRFRLTPHHIGLAVASAKRQAERRTSRVTTDGNGDAEGARLTTADLVASARRGSGQELAALATRLEPVHAWDELVLPADTLVQLREMCERVSLRHTVLERWGFDRRFSRGKGVNALFSGSSGTGKTMAAEVIAGELGLDLFRVELAGVVSKYIGETEKNLDRIFSAAERSNGIVLFDEADALFGKRSEVHDAHDRYANIEISYLLQRMEEYDGIAILSTNLRGNLDAAFVRRLAFMVHFPFPDEASRARIWRAVWPAEAPLGDDLDFELLASRFAMSGGNIRNIALSAAFLAAHEASAVSMRHVLAATKREYQKLGKTLDEIEDVPQRLVRP